MAKYKLSKFYEMEIRCTFKNDIHIFILVIYELFRKYNMAMKNKLKILDWKEE